MKIVKKGFKIVFGTIVVIFIIIGGLSLLSDVYTFSVIKMNNLYKDTQLDKDYEMIRKDMSNHKLDAVAFDTSAEYKEGSFTNRYGRIEVMSLDDEKKCQQVSEYINHLAFKNKIDFTCENDKSKYNEFKKHSAYFDALLTY